MEGYSEGAARYTTHPVSRSIHLQVLFGGAGSNNGNRNQTVGPAQLLKEVASLASGGGQVAHLSLRDNKDVVLASTTRMDHYDVLPASTYRLGEHDVVPASSYLLSPQGFWPHLLYSQGAQRRPGVLSWF